MRRGGCIPSSAARCTRKLQLAPYTTLGWRSWWRTGSWSRATPPERGRPGRGPTCWYDVLWRLHRAGFSLRGHFSADNFLVYLATLDLRMRGTLHISRKGASKITAPSHGRWGRPSPHCGLVGPGWWRRDWRWVPHQVQHRTYGTKTSIGYTDERA
jgi:hypothetical protein